MMMASENDFRDENEGPDSPTIRTYVFRIYQYRKCLSDITPHLEPTVDRRIVCNDRYIYAFGDYRLIPSFRTPSNSELWQYNIDSQSWVDLHVENFPRGVLTSETILDGKYLLVFAKSGNLYHNDTIDDLYVCDLEPPGEVYNFKLVPTTGERPLILCDHCVVKDGEYLYTIGVANRLAYHMDVHRLNLRTKVWETLFLKSSEERLQERYQDECALFNNKIYIFGGSFDNEQVFGFEELPVFDLKTREWSLELTHGDTSLEAGKQYPSRRIYYSCVQAPGNNAQVFIIGGYNNNNQNSINLKTSCWMIDLNTIKWKKISSLQLRYGTYCHSSAITPSGKLYVHGGRIFDDYGFLQRTKSMFEAWIQVPSLKEMCWEAALQFVHKLPIDYLKRLPIPAEYKKRLLDLPGISDEP